MSNMEFKEAVSTALTSDSQAERSEVLSEVTNYYQESTSALAQVTAERDNLLKEVADLKEQNMSLFARVSLPEPESEITTIEEEHEDEELKPLSELF